MFLAVIPCLDDSLLCSGNGLCGFNATTRKFQCSCKKGYIGDGIVCKGNIYSSYILSVSVRECLLRKHKPYILCSVLLYRCFRLVSDELAKQQKTLCVWLLVTKVRKGERCMNTRYFVYCHLQHISKYILVLKFNPKLFHIIFGVISALYVNIFLPPQLHFSGR